MTELHCAINNFTRAFLFLFIFFFFFVKLVGGQISDQYFMLACLSDSPWISGKLIIMHTDKRNSRRIDGKLDPFHYLLFQFKPHWLSFYDFKRTVLPVLEKKCSKKPLA